MTHIIRATFAERLTSAVDRLTAKVANGHLLRGVFVAFSDPRLIDLWASAGADYVILDLEHATYGISETDRLIHAAVNAGVPPLVRVVAADPQLMRRCLDAGAAGIVVPDVRRPEAARELTRVINHPPLGDRGLSQVRANDWGVCGLHSQGLPNPLLVPMIESIEAVDTCATLFAMSKASWWHVGKADLEADRLANAPSRSMEELLRSLAAAAAAHGAVLGLNQPDNPSQLQPPDGYISIANTDRNLVYAGGRRFLEGQ